MVIQLGAKPLADFDRPLEMMADCHRRIEHFLGILQRVATSVNDALSADEEAALTTALDYFHGSLPLHNADEESSLFPRMRVRGGDGVAKALVVVEQLEADHEAAGNLHRRVDMIGRAWLRERAIDPARRQELHDLLKLLANTYEQHIALEEHEVFPVAASVLGADELAKVGVEMRTRRGGSCAQRRQAARGSSDNQ